MCGQERDVLLLTVCSGMVLLIEEGRGASKNPHWTFDYFIYISQQEACADIIQISAVRNISQKTEGTKTKTARYFFLLMSFEFFAIFSYCFDFAKFVAC
jgi:hypothetical protein